MIGYIYLITCPKDYYYIGSTVNYDLRISQHQNALDNKSNSNLYHQMRKLNYNIIESIILEVVEVSDRKELFEKEEKTIFDYASDKCLNITFNHLYVGVKY